MIYRAIGLMSGSSLDGLDIVYTELHENGGKWTYTIEQAECIPYNNTWVQKLQNAINLNACDYLLLHTEYGHYIGNCVNNFIQKHHLQFKIAVVSSHGHTTFHIPSKKMTAQLGDGAAIAAVTGLPVVTDLRAMDIALGGQGAPIVPIGEKLLLGNYNYFLNLGGIANISVNTNKYTAFDICPANRVLNMLVAETGNLFDKGGAIAKAGSIIPDLLTELNQLDYYQQPYPKSLANSFGTDVVYPIIKKYNEPVENRLHTYVQHIVHQIAESIKPFKTQPQAEQLLVTGGGALNTYLVNALKNRLAGLQVTVAVPDDKLVQYKEALIMALIGVLRWREENNVLSSVTGSSRNSVGGAMWMGQEE